jgi:hypothetical protein
MMVSWTSLTPAADRAAIRTALVSIVSFLDDQGLPSLTPGSIDAAHLQLVLPALTDEFVAAMSDVAGRVADRPRRQNSTS